MNWNNFSHARRVNRQASRKLACYRGETWCVLLQTLGSIITRLQEVCTSPFTPLGYGAATAAFGTIIRRICGHMYLGTENQIPTETTISALINQVEVWWNALPDYLRYANLSPPSYSRAISYLGLRYNYALMLITRRYLLQSLLSGHDCAPEVASRTEVCERASDRSTTILLGMAEKNMISDLIWFDAYFILCNSIVLYLQGVRHASSSTHQKQIQDYIPILKSMRRSLLSECALKSMEALLADLESNSTSE
jgi:hypothetical protein